MTLEYFAPGGKSALVTGASSGLGVHFARITGSTLTVDGGLIETPV
jgi:NADP-dependent 3-hydroxy acid dehydrogenase YdfG